MKSLEIYQIQAKSFYMLAQKQDHEIFIITIKNIKKILNLKLYINSCFHVFKKYYDLIDMFEKQNVNKLSLH